MELQIKRMNIVAIVVTYNRKKLLEECLEAILSQTFSVNKIILIDNNSNDGTYQFLKENNILCDKIIYKRLDSNIGGAGGFYEGFKLAQKYSPDYLWIMDDDTMPNKDCLKNLVEALEELKNEKISFLASSIYGVNKEPMNVPAVNTDESVNGYPNWYNYLDKGIIKIREATFVSLLINNKAVEKVGYPVKFYFIWGDDTEYTLRLNRYYGNAYMVGKSVAIHKRVISQKLSIFTEDNKNRIRFNFYLIRNNLINKKEYYGTKNCASYFIKYLVKSFAVLLNPKTKYRFMKFSVIQKALFSFLFKRYDYKAFKNRFNRNVKYL